MVVAEILTGIALVQKSVEFGLTLLEIIPVIDIEIHLDISDTLLLTDVLDLVLIPGDLVDNGINHTEWGDHFFGPSEPLFSHVPLYPVLGNHENNSSYYFS